MSEQTGGFLVPRWFAEGKSPPEPEPLWGEVMEGIRVYEGEDELRFGYKEPGVPTIRASNDCGCGYIEIDMRDLLHWIEENTAYLDYHKGKRVK